MSQFWIIESVIEAVDVDGVIIKDLYDASDIPSSFKDHLKRISAGDVSRIKCIVDADTGISDTLFVEAQEELSRGTHFQATRLSEIIRFVCPVSSKIIMWYGDEWNDLDLANNCFEMQEVVELQLKLGSGEVYATVSAENRG